MPGANRIPVVTPAAATLHWRGGADIQLSATDAEGDPFLLDLVAQPRLKAIVWLDRSRGAGG